MGSFEEGLSVSLLKRLLEGAEDKLPSFADIDVQPSLMPKIRWRKPTDSELELEFKSEYGLEKLFYSGIQSYEPGWTKRGVAGLKKIAKLVKTDPEKAKVVIQFGSLERMREVTTSYGLPKDPDSMLRAIFDGKSLPAPVATIRKDGSIAILGGNTRWAFARYGDQPLTVYAFFEKDALAKFKSESILDRLKSQGRFDGEEPVAPFLNAFVDAVVKKDKAAAKEIQGSALDFVKSYPEKLFSLMTIKMWFDYAEQYWEALGA